MFLRLFLITLPIYIALDLVWLGVVAKKFYAKHLGFLMRPDPNWYAAVCFYCIFAAGIVFFVIQPAVEKKALVQAVTTGALFGLVTYGTYDLVNHAVVKDWPTIVTIVDMAWGVVVCATVATATYVITQFLFSS